VIRIEQLLVVCCAATCGFAVSRVSVAGIILVPQEHPTIAAAIAAASSGDIIQLAPGTYTEPFSFGAVGVTIRGDPNAPSSVVVAPTSGPPRSAFVVSAEPNGGTVAFEGLTFGGHVKYVVSAGALSITACATTPTAGGASVAFTVTLGSLEVDGLDVPDLGALPALPLFTVDEGTASILDVGIAQGARPVALLSDASSVLETVLIQNLTLTSGAAVTVLNGEASILDGSFTGISDAIGISGTGAAITIVGCSFASIGNPASGTARAIAVVGPTVTIVDCSITGCGGRFAPASAATLQCPGILVKNTTISNNNLSETGAGALLLSGIGTIQTTTFDGNSTKELGGAIRLTGAYSIESCVFRNNIGGAGDGAVSVDGGGAFYGCDFFDNHAGDGQGNDDIYGGAVTVHGGQGVFVECSFSGNVAGSDGKSIGYGGAVASLNGVLAFDSCMIVGNTAQDLAGGIYLDPSAGELLMENTTVCSNVPDQIIGIYNDLGGNTVCGCLGDLNGNDGIAADDLAALLGAWGPCESCAEDLNADDKVDAADLAVLLGAWGGCAS